MGIYVFLLCFSTPKTKIKIKTQEKQDQEKKKKQIDFWLQTILPGWLEVDQSPKYP